MQCAAAVQLLQAIILATLWLTVPTWTSASAWASAWASGSTPTCATRYNRDEKLDQRAVERLCERPKEAASRLKSMTLRFCEQFTAASFVTNVNVSWEMQLTSVLCERMLMRLIEADDLVRLQFEQFAAVLFRFDCFADMIDNTCDQCAEAYKQWLCSTELLAESEMDAKEEKRKPCLRLCEKVAEFCPILTPEDPLNPDMSGTRSEYVFQCPTTQHNEYYSEADLLHCYLPCEPV